MTATELEQPVAQPSRFRRALPWVALALVLFPFVWSAVALVIIGSRLHAFGDIALTELRVRDVGHHAVLVGPFSRGEWSHPGPALFYLLAIPYRLVGGNTIGLYLGALAINAAAIAGMGIIAKRHGGTALMMLTLVGCALVERAFGGAFLRDPWNPYITVLPFGLLVFLTWAMSCGDRWALPIAVGVASFCAQTHVGFVVLALPLFVWGVASLVLFSRRDASRSDDDRRPARRLRNPLLVTAAVAVVMWLPPVIDQVGSTGNFTKTIDWFRHPPSAKDAVIGGRHTFLEGYRVVAAQFAAIPEWIRGAAPPIAGFQPTIMQRVPFPLLLLAFGAAWIVAWKLRARRALRLMATITFALVLGVVSVERTIGAVFEYRLGFSWVLGMSAMVASAWVAWILVAPRIGRVRRFVAPIGIAILAGLTVANVVEAAYAGTPERPDAQRLARMAPAAFAALPPTRGAVLVRGLDFGSYGYADGLLLWLDRHGVRARVDKGAGAAFASHLVIGHGPIRATLTFAEDTLADDTMNDPHQRLVAYEGDLTPAQRAVFLPQFHDLDAKWRAGSIDFGTRVAKQAEVTRRMGHAYAIFESV